MTDFYIDSDGFYVGAFDGATPPVGSIKVDAPPPDARMKWDGSKWIVPTDVKAEMILEKRQYEYDQRGSTFDEMIVALWERVVEGRPEASDAIQLIRKKVKEDYPK